MVVKCQVGICPTICSDAFQKIVDEDGERKEGKEEESGKARKQRNPARRPRTI